jgi:hypothetical protein
MLPDLWRMAHRHVRPSLGPVEAGSSVRLSEMLAGVTHHGRVDTAFHASASFREGERTMARALGAIEAPRLSLFAHIAWELCLDGALVRREGTTLLSRVRDGIALARETTDDETAALAAARVHHFARKGEALPPGFDARADHMLRELGRGRWIEGYAEGAVVAERIDGIRTRLGFEALAPERRAILGAVFDDAIDRAASALDPLLAISV